MSMLWAHMTVQLINLFMTTQSLDDGTDERMDGWMGHVMKKLHEKRPRRPLLYVIVA
jgi:hypothetical protein